LLIEQRQLLLPAKQLEPGFRQAREVDIFSSRGRNFRGAGASAAKSFLITKILLFFSSPFKLFAGEHKVLCQRTVFAFD